MVISIAFPSVATAEVILEDDFTNTSLVDMTKTDAVVDTEAGEVRLPKIKMPNAIDMLKYGEGYAVTASDGVIISEYDAATGALHDTKINWLTNARGLAIRQDNMSLWAIGDDHVQYCQFSGGAYSDDPALKSSGLTEVLSVDSIDGTDQAVVLSRTDSGKAKITRYRAGTSLTVELEKELDIGEPVALSVVDGTPDVVVVTKTGKHYLMFDDATQDYIEDTARKASGYSNIVSASANQDGTAILEGDEGQYLQDDDAGGAQQVLAYSAGQVPGALALSLKPGAYDQAFITETGEVQYFIYDDATDQMTRVSTGADYDTVKLTALTETPAGTGIVFYVSTDSGATWTEITPGQWEDVPYGREFVVKAVLDTTDPLKTPKITHIKLEVTTLELMDLEIVAIALNDPGQPEPVTSFPARVKAGAEIMFRNTTKGCAEQVSSLFTTGLNVTLTPDQPVTTNENTWEGFFTVPVDSLQGSNIGAILTARRGDKEKHLVVDPFILVDGKVYESVSLKLTR